MESRRGVTNEPRNVAIYLERYLRGEKLDSLANKFRVKKYSTVSCICTRMEKRVMQRFDPFSHLPHRHHRFKSRIARR
jgi:chromosomal replication initiation ATPase DnaA